jgi:hypothetical protein
MLLNRRSASKMASTEDHALDYHDFSMAVPGFSLRTACSTCPLTLLERHRQSGRSRKILREKTAPAPMSMPTWPHRVHTPRQRICVHGYASLRNIRRSCCGYTRNVWEKKQVHLVPAQILRCAVPTPREEISQVESLKQMSLSSFNSTSTTEAPQDGSIMRLSRDGKTWKLC